MSKTIDERRAISKRNWADAFARLFELAGPYWPIGSDLSDSALVAAETAANEATAAYVECGTPGARLALTEWETLMSDAIRRVKARKEK